MPARWTQYKAHPARGGRRTGTSAARHQILEVAKQCDVWTDPDGDDFCHGLAARVAAPTAPLARPSWTRRRGRHARRPPSSAGSCATSWPRSGREKQAAGRERYELASQYFLGAKVDLDETYAWGFEELARIEAEMRAVADKIAGPGATVDEAVAALDADPARTHPGKEAFRDWMQAAGRPGRSPSCTAPTSTSPSRSAGSSAASRRPATAASTTPARARTSPARAGCGGRCRRASTDFSTWREVTTVYHEGVPGPPPAGRRRPRSAPSCSTAGSGCSAGVSGHGEGWALYAERLMDELGYLDDPGDKLGMLDGQAFRAARVIVDIGMHLELEIPRGQPVRLPPGRALDAGAGLGVHAGALPACRTRTLRFELNRYLGWPGQAPSYKVGERIWLQARDDAKARKGADFDLKAFHRDALNLGSLGLDPLRRALARL